MRFTSPHKDLHLPPAESTTLPGFLLGCVGEYHDQRDDGLSNLSHASSSRDCLDAPFLHPAPTDSVFHGRPQAKALSLRDVNTRAHRLARGLLQGKATRGKPFEKGDVVAFYSASQHDYVPASLGIHLAGGVAALCNPSYKPEELAHQLRMTKSSLIITNATQPTRSDEHKARTTPLDNAREAARLASKQDDDESAGGFEHLAAEPVVLVFDEKHECSLDSVYGAEELSREDLAKIKERSSTVGGSDTAVYCFSSGTSGLPKAVVLTHQNLVANTIQATFLLHDRMNEPLLDGKYFSPDGKISWYDEAEEHGAGHDVPAVPGTAGKAMHSNTISKLVDNIKTTFSLKSKQRQDNDDEGEGAQIVAARPDVAQEFHIDVLPQFHCYGLLVNLVAIHTVTPRIVLPRFHLETYLSSIAKHHVTFGFVVPPILLALAKQPSVDDYDVSSLWRVASGAAALPDEITNAVGTRLGIRCTDGYGMTEMSPIIAMQTVRDIVRKPKSVGALAPNTQALVLGEDGETQLGANEEGELVLRGPQMMQGYLHNDEANEKAFMTIKENDGSETKWLHTGDIAKVDEHGYITITDRLKDVIKAKGFQVSPAELEGLIFKDARVQDAAVVGVKAKDGAEQPWAFLVLREEKDDADSIIKEILAAVNKRVAGYKKMEGGTRIDALPKNDAGKVLKKDLRAKYDADRK